MALESICGTADAAGQLVSKQTKREKKEYNRTITFCVNLQALPNHWLLVDEMILVLRKADPEHNPSRALRVTQESGYEFRKTFSLATNISWGACVFIFCCAVCTYFHVSILGLERVCVSLWLTTPTLQGKRLSAALHLLDLFVIVRFVLSAFFLSFLAPCFTPFIFFIFLRCQRRRICLTATKRLNVFLSRRGLAGSWAR